MKSRLLSCLPLLTLLAATTAPAAVIFDRGVQWRWRPGTTEASTPVESWRTVAFDDSGFSTAPAPFWYGDQLPGGTVITGMQNVYGSIFLRKTFVISDPAEVSSLRLGGLVDDGFVAWINGVEVQRVNMAGAAGSGVTITTLANNAPEPVPFMVYDLTSPLPTSYLVAGTNVIAVQVFQSSLNSSDLGFDASLEFTLRETIPPVISNVSPAAGLVTNLTDIIVSFSEPMSGVDAPDLVVGGNSALVVTPLTTSSYRFTFQQPAYGNVTVAWRPDHGITDQALPPNPFNATGAGATWAYQLEDRTLPVMASVAPAAGTTVRTLGSIEVVFNEPVVGVDVTDLLVNGNIPTNVTSLGANAYIFAFAPPPTGSVQVAWRVGHGIRDLAAVPNAFQGGSWSYRFDPNAPEESPYISEFMASNTRTLADQTGQFEDWIEIYNPSALVANLDGWYLTDSASNPTKWRFPATNLLSGKSIVVFASGTSRRVPGAPLHTNFRLSAGGSYLALVRPDGVTIASQFSPVYPSQVPDVSYGWAQFAGGNDLVAGTNGVYFTRPTPGQGNVGGVNTPGPVVEAATHFPIVPLDNQDLVVSARILPSFFPVAGASLRYRIMFSNEVTIPMWDDGTRGDRVAGDSIYAATIPANLSTDGQMIRYAITATDVNSNPSRWPLFTTPTNSAEYLGTIVNPTNVTSKLPIFHLFISPQNLPGVDTETGGRASFFHDGEFYDNIYMELRGNTSAGLPKKSHRLEFNREHELRHPGPGGRIRKTSLLAEYLDPAYLRNHLCFWFLDMIGTPSPFHYPVRVQLNGSFYQLAFHNDVIGQEQVERLGYDPAGALYKAVGTFTPNFFSTGVFQKLEPDNDTSRTDYLQLANGINENSSAAVRRATLFDLLDVPQVINDLAGSRWCSENDDVWANMSMYRDTFGDQLWRKIPFDMNASWGQLYGGSDPLEATVDSSKSNPLYGGATTAVGNWNRLYDAIVQVPETRQMLLRRQRSIMDRWIQSPDTAPDQLIIENHIKYMTNLMADEVAIDRARWGNSPWAPNKSYTNGVNDLLNQFVAARRRHWFATHSITNTTRAIGINSANNAGIPLTQPANATLVIAGLEFNPSSGNQDQEFLCLSNPAPIAIDITDWKITGGIEFTFAPGTVVPSNGVVYVSPNVRTFKTRTTGPRGGQGLFVVGPYKGQLSARGESLTVLNDRGQVLQTLTYPGSPSLAQQFLRITEIMYHPSAHPANPLAEEFEYLELRNTSPGVSLNLNGVRFTNGIDFNFTGSAITNLAPGGRVLLVKNPTAFNARYGNGQPVAGQFSGSLDNAGERIQLLDSLGEEILDFSYNNSWYPVTDGLGFSLAIVDDLALWSTWDEKSSWRPSGGANGTPGGPDPLPPTQAPVWINEALTASVDPAVDAVEIHNPGAEPGSVGGWYLSDDFYTPKKFRIASNTTIPAEGYLVLSEADFNADGAGFAFAADGDDVWLFAADGAGELTGYYHGFDFGAMEAGVTLGRHVNSQGVEYFVPQSANTLGTANAGPLAGPVVVSEIMYRPADFAGGVDNAIEEFIELQNVTGSPVALHLDGSPTNTWRLRNAVDFDLPPGTILPAGGRLLVVGFDPVTDPVALARFRATYELGPSVTILGPWQGKLDNSGETVELKKPVAISGGPAAQSLVERIQYRQSAPWPANADGLGSSLQRIASHTFGNEPTNWFAAGITPGGANLYNVNPTVTLVLPTPGSRYQQPTNIVLTANPVDTDGTIVRVEFYSNGVLVGDATSAPFSYTWAAAVFGEQVITARAKDNLLGIAWSAPVTITLISQPPTVALTSPTPGGIITAGTLVPVTATAVDPDGSVTNVQFFADGMLLGTDTSAPYSLNWVAVGGSRRFQAVATDDSGTTTTSAPVDIFVSSLLNTNLQLVGSNSVWRYLETNANPTANWNTLQFNDGGWKSGPGQLGFGDGDEATRVTNAIVVGNVTNRIITYYFRRPLVIDSLVGVTNAILRVLRDDGAVAYLNGEEVFRSNMATGRISYTNLALTSVGGVDESTFFPTNIPLAKLLIGTNLLAVEIHQNTTNNIDMSFAAEFVLQRSVVGPTITSQPASRTNQPGTTASFMVTAVGGEPLAYQWYFAGGALASETGPVLTIADVQPARAGAYSVVVSNLAGAVTSAVAMLTVGPSDRDGDGLPDDWEIANGTNPDVADAFADPDADGHNNSEEYVAGTIPTDGSSVLRITRVALTDGSTATVITFSAVQNHTYSLFSRPVVTGGPWLKVGDVLTVPLTGPVSITNANAGASELFYRIATPQQP